VLAGSHLPIRFSELANTPHSPIAILLQRNGKAPDSPIIRPRRMQCLAIRFSEWQMANERRMHLPFAEANGKACGEG